MFYTSLFDSSFRSTILLQKCPAKSPQEIQTPSRKEECRNHDISPDNTIPASDIQSSIESHSPECESDVSNVSDPQSPKVGTNDFELRRGVENEETQEPKEQVSVTELPRKKSCSWALGDNVLQYGSVCGAQCGDWELR